MGGLIDFGRGSGKSRGGGPVEVGGAGLLAKKAREEGVAALGAAVLYRHEVGQTALGLVHAFQNIELARIKSDHELALKVLQHTQGAERTLLNEALKENTPEEKARAIQVFGVAHAQMSALNDTVRLVNGPKHSNGQPVCPNCQDGWGRDECQRCKGQGYVIPSPEHLDLLNEVASFAKRKDKDEDKDEYEDEYEDGGKNGGEGSFEPAQPIYYPPPAHGHSPASTIYYPPPGAVSTPRDERSGEVPAQVAESTDAVAAEAAAQHSAAVSAPRTGGGMAPPTPAQRHASRLVAFMSGNLASAYALMGDHAHPHGGDDSDPLGLVAAGSDRGTSSLPDPLGARATGDGAGQSGTRCSGCDRFFNGNRGLATHLARSKCGKGDG